MVISHTDRDSDKENYEKKKKEAMKKNADHENVVVLSLVIEASIEASFQESVKKYNKIRSDMVKLWYKSVKITFNPLFQFFFQTAFILPSLLKSVTGSGTDWEELVNAKTLSILMSFFSFARSFYAIRFGGKHNIT